jgi:hypothetical protein
MENQEYKAFKTRVITLISILAVLVFLLYIGILLILNMVPLDAKGIEMVKIEKRRELPNSWTVHLKLKAEGYKLNVLMNIREGKIVGGAAGESLADIKF